MNTPHKHAELIKLWADGAEIEVRGNNSGKWVYQEEPDWNRYHEYRIKPTPHPKQEFIDAVNQGKQIQYLSKYGDGWQDICIFDELPITKLVESYEYRIKPEDIVVQEKAWLYSKTSVGLDHHSIENNVQFTFDAITHQLKDVKLIAP